jgi:hypothetical protein
VFFLFENLIIIWAVSMELKFIYGAIIGLEWERRSNEMVWAEPMHPWPSGTSR